MTKATNSIYAALYAFKPANAKLSGHEIIKTANFRKKLGLARIIKVLKKLLGTKLLDLGANT